MNEGCDSSAGITNPAFSIEEKDVDNNTKLPMGNMELKERLGSIVNEASVNTHVHEDEGGGCGWFWLQPNWLQKFRTAKWVLFWLCCAAAVQGMVINGFVNVVISTIEKRFHLKSAKTGLIAGCYDIGAVLCSIPVSYLGSLPGASKPRWLGWGLFIMGLGSFTFALPHFISPPYEIRGTELDKNLNQSVLLCFKAGTTESSADVSDCSEVSANWLSNLQYIFLLGQFLHGIGASPLYILGITYLDECVPLKMSSFYLGIFHAMAVVGPAAGYVIGGRLLSIYVDVPNVDPDTLGLSQESDLWLGAWWIGFLISGTIAVSISWIVMAFPVEIPGAKKRALERIGSPDHMGAKAFAHIRHLPRAVKILVKNLTFVFLSLAEASEGALIAGCATFMPKVIENQFGFSAGFAALCVGVVTVPAGGGGTFLGGYVVKRFKMTCREILRFCFIVSFIVLLLCVGFIKPCKEALFAGVNVEYDDREIIPTSPSLSFPCNEACSCNLRSSFDPVCGVNNVMYYSPCHAGCTSSEKLPNGQNVFTDCKCIDFLPSKNISSSTKETEITEMDLLLQRSSSASRRSCSVGSCNVFWWYLLLFFVVIFLTFLIMMPSMSGTLRCVPDTHRSLALGLQGIQSRVLGTIPGPILFGALIMDQSCYLWQSTCDGSAGSCHHYDNTNMTLNLVLVCLFFKSISTILYFLAWWYYKNTRKPNNQTPSENGVIPEESTVTS